MFTLALVLLSAILLFFLGLSWPKKATEVQVNVSKIKKHVVRHNRLKPHFLRNMINGMTRFIHGTFVKSAKAGKTVRNKLPF